MTKKIKIIWTITMTVLLLLDMIMHFTITNDIYSINYFASIIVSFGLGCYVTDFIGDK